MYTRPLTLKQANEYVEKFHRHHKRCAGHRFSIAAYDSENNECIGVAIVGRPVCRSVDQYLVAEINRLCTNGTKNACSFLYSSCARICKEMGFKYIQTYTLPEEGGVSLKASGWIFDGETNGGSWNSGGKNSHKNRREDQPMSKKVRWRRDLNN